MLYREIIAVCSEIHSKHISTLCEQNVELLNVGPYGIYRVYLKCFEKFEEWILHIKTNIRFHVNM